MIIIVHFHYNANNHFFLPLKETLCSSITMKKIIALLLAVTPICSAGEEVGEGCSQHEGCGGHEAGDKKKEWQEVAQPADLALEHGVIDFLKKAQPNEELDTKGKAILESLRKLVSGAPINIKPTDLLNFKQVRSTQISPLKITQSEYADCLFKKTKRGVFFEKSTESKFKTGKVFEDSEQSLIFLGATKTNQKVYRNYSGFTGNPNTKHDSAGIIIKREKNYIMILPGKNKSFEVYEFL